MKVRVLDWVLLQTGVFEERPRPVSAKEGTVSKRLSVDELFKGRHFDGEIIVLCVRWYLVTRQNHSKNE
jgi:hypothetical protein